MEEPHPHTTPDEPTHDPPPAPLPPSPSIPEPAPQPPAHDPPLYPEHDRQGERRAPDAPQGHTDLPPDAIVYDESRTPG